MRSGPPPGAAAAIGRRRIAQRVPAPATLAAMQDRMTVAWQGKLDYVRELQRVLERAGVPSTCVPLPSGG